ncbi:MAG: polyphenol oxidase family protein [Deltaproteobacteria bacterium]|nr:polyphenol oxidase family protein [Deltaproteobacteria bacterium]
MTGPVIGSITGSMTRSASGRHLCDPVLEGLGVGHGFAERGAQVPDYTVFPHQIHGVGVVRGEALRAGAPSEADAIVSTTPGVAIGIVTADCVPILVASADGGCVAAIHAGWRGLAAGVIEAGIEAMGQRVGGLRAAVGPAARGCCYEVDEPVAAALARRYEGLLAGVLVPGRPGRHQLDLPALAARVLARIGVGSDRIGAAACLCTICTPGPRFESFRRDGPASGRLRHFIEPAPAADGRTPEG